MDRDVRVEHRLRRHYGLLLIVRKANVDKQGDYVGTILCHFVYVASLGLMVVRLTYFV